jgi:ABC-type taurine transport system ATPase subunit
LTVLDNVAFRLKMQGMGKQERRAQAHEILEKVQLDTSRRSRRYGNMKRKSIFTRIL